MNHIIANNVGKRLIVIENEFGTSIGVESLIARLGVESKELAGFYEIGNGCLCCTVKDSLLSTLERVVATRIDQVDLILIETTGLANPGPVIEVFWTDQAVNTSLYLDGVVAVIDCRNFHQTIENGVPLELAAQVCYSDRIVINKVDLVDEAILNSVTSSIRDMNPLATIAHSSYCSIDLNFVFNLSSYHLDSHKNRLTSNLYSLSLIHATSPSAWSTVLETTSTCISRQSFNTWMSRLVECKDIMRIKGIVMLDGCWTLVQCVYGLYDLVQLDGAALEGLNVSKSKVVVILRMPISACSDLLQFPS